MATTKRQRGEIEKLPSGSYSLGIESQLFRDLSILKDAPISELSLVNCQITDLTPLRDLPLEYLNLPGNPITDLSPLAGKQIKSLYLSGTKVSDFSPITSLPLKNLYLDNCENVADVAALAQISTLEMTTIPMQAANIEALRKLPKPRRCGGSGSGLRVASEAAMANS
jgi:Leucine-rich repeat (LRR) protein